MDNELVRKRYPGLFFNTLGFEERYPDGESPKEFMIRVIKAFKLVASREINNVLIVTHGGVISLILYYIQNIQWTNKIPVLPCVPTGIYELEYDMGNYRILKSNDNKHLILG